MASGAERWSRQEFEALPLLDRVRMLASGQLRFFSGDREVTPQDALRD